VALIVTTVVVQLLHLPVASLAGPAFTIALLAAIESLLSAVVADGSPARPEETFKTAS